MALFFAGKNGPWQQRYARPNWTSLLTKLSPTQESQFQVWSRINRVPVTPDYDMRGYYLHRFDNAVGQTAINPNDGMTHYPDTYKTPLHQSFSGESLFADPASHPPMWNDRDQLVLPNGQVLFDERSQRPR